MLNDRDAMLLLISKTDRAVEAAKILRAIDKEATTAHKRAVALIRISVDEVNDLTDADRAQLRELIPPAREQGRTEIVRFRCTPNERAVLQMLAEKYADGNMSRLILDALQSKYPTL